VQLSETRYARSGDVSIASLEERADDTRAVVALEAA
jgi:hypothetical protein